MEVDSDVWIIIDLEDSTTRKKNFGIEWTWNKILYRMLKKGIGDLVH